MAILKKNIWSLFYIIAFVGVIILSSIVYKVFFQIEKELQLEQENIVKVTSSSLNSIFLQYESVLDILGIQLTLDNSYQTLNKARPILDNVLKLNSSIIAFGLAKPNGQLYITSSNLKNIKKLPNLLNKEETRDSFALALNSDIMVIGRTYYHKTLDTLIIPIRKAIRNNTGETVAVMTAGIHVNKTFSFLKNTKNEVFLFRNLDYYYQLTSQRTKSNLSIYDNPIPKTYIEATIRKIEKKYNTTLKKIKENKKVTTIMTNRYKNKSEILESFQYLERYDIWVVSYLPYTLIMKNVYSISSVLVLIFILVSIIIYYLFRYIDGYEKQKQEALYHQATHDYLTNLSNRLYLKNEFRTLDSNKPFSLLFIDMDNFKSVNDNFGHDFGDKLLKEVSNRLVSFRKDNDSIVRYSGDEFFFITNVTDKVKIKDISANIIKELSQPYHLGQYQFRLGASIGISQFPEDADNFDDIKRYADIALSEAKKEKNTYSIFEDSIKHKYLKQSLIENELKNALENNEIYMMYQPQINRNGTLYGVEALVRWDNNKLGFIAPDVFIGIAENSGMMGDLGKFIIKESLSEIQKLQQKLQINFQLSINISVKQFIEKDFYENLLIDIEKYDFDKIKLTLEVTENVFIDDVDFIVSLLNKLKQQDIKVSLDDFGTGYSSLSLLKQLPIDELKIDKTFVDDILIDDDSLSMVENIISIGKRLNMVVLAEGVETIEQKELLQNYGCDLFQGYYFSKPLKKEDLEVYLGKKF